MFVNLSESFHNGTCQRRAELSTKHVVTNRAIKLNMQYTKWFCLSNTYLTNPPLGQRARVSHSSIPLPWLLVFGEVAQLYCGAKTAKHHLFLGPTGEGDLWHCPSCSGLYPLGSWNSKDGDPSPFGQEISSSAESSSQWKYCLGCSQYLSSFSSGPLFPHLLPCPWEQSLALSFQ